jgi:hypothetical protein
MQLQKNACVLAVILGLASGCFRYRDAPIRTAVPAGESVRVALTDAGRVNVAPMAGEGVDQIDGIVDVFSPDSVVLRVTSVRRRDVPETWTRERLRVAVNDVRTISVRRFDPIRTTLLVGGVLLAGTAVRLGTSDSFFGGRGRPGGSNTGR